jgi:cholesterol transport system auxiliary component
MNVLLAQIAGKKGGAGNIAGGRKVVKAALVAGLLSVSACTSLVPSPPPSTYDLTAPQSFPNLKGSTRAQILILEPSALKTLDSQDIVIKPSGTEVEYLAKSQWSDRLPKLVQARLIEAFENTDRVRAVAKPGEGLVIDYQVVSDIRAFQADVASGLSEARVSISIKLVSDRTGKVVRSKVFEEVAGLSGTTGLQVVTGLDAAFDRVAREIVAWTFAGI